MTTHKPTTVARIIEGIDWQLGHNAKQIQEFTDKLADDPARALEWYGDQAVTAAIKTEASDQDQRCSLRLDKDARCCQGARQPGRLLRPAA